MTTRPRAALRLTALLVAFVAAAALSIAIGVAAHAEPGDPGHPPDICAETPDAPYCAGPSVRECPGAGEVPEDQPCPGNDTDALGGEPVPEDWESICNRINDDQSFPARCDRLGENGCRFAHCIVRDPVKFAALGVDDDAPPDADPAATPDVLPATGAGHWALGLAGVLSIAGGFALTRKVTA